MEIGTGIGTICDLITSTTNLKYIGFEREKICLELLRLNVDLTKCLIYQNFTDLLVEVKAKKLLLVIDDFIRKSDLELLLSVIQPKYIIIEGHRFQTRRDVVSIIHSSNKKFSFIIKLYIYSPDSKKGAFVMITHLHNNPFLKAIFKLTTNVAIQRFKFVNQDRIYRSMRFLRVYTQNTVRRIGKLNPLCKRFVTF